MAFKPNLSVKESLDHLAKQLDQIISRKLAPGLGDHPWTVVLDILDQKKGFATSHQHWTYDLQAQLRMLTERLGDLGYPFDDHQRTVSTLGNELRIVRKQMAHMHDFSVAEAFRASDFCLRLLEHFGDGDGQEEAHRIRHEALAALAVEEGVTELAAAATAGPGALPAPPTTAKAEPEPGAEAMEVGVELEVVSPDPEVLELAPSIIGAARLQFEPWSVVQIGGVEVLDDLPKKVAKESVRAVAVEIATFEGPIHLDRLVQKTAQSFGLQRVRAGREKKLVYQIHQAGLFIDADKFVWPREIDPASWTGFRPSDSSADRPFIHISPIEIANATRFIVAKRPGITTEDLDVSVLQTFGRRRRTKQLAAHLAKATALR